MFGTVLFQQGGAVNHFQETDQETERAFGTLIDVHTAGEQAVIATLPEAPHQLEAENSDSDSTPVEKPPVAQRNGKASGTRSRKTAAEAMIAAESLLQPAGSSGAKSNGAHPVDSEDDSR